MYVCICIYKCSLDIYDVASYSHRVAIRHAELFYAYGVQNPDYTRLNSWQTSYYLNSRVDSHTAMLTYGGPGISILGSRMHAACFPSFVRTYRLLSSNIYCKETAVYMCVCVYV